MPSLTAAATRITVALACTLPLSLGPAAAVRPAHAVAAHADVAHADVRAAKPKPKTGFVTWPTYHGSVSRAGKVTSGVPRARISKAWTRNFGEVDGQPILVKDTLVAATQGNVVHGLDAATGKDRWQVSLGTPVPGQQLQCGYLEQIGIISTPAFDPVTGSLFVVAETTGGVHTLWALDPATGRKKWSRNLDVRPGQDPLTVKNRAAILVAKGHVYVSFGSAGGDCGAYVGYITSTPTSGKGAIREYHTATTNYGGMWTPAGPVLGRNGSVYMSVGEGAATSGEWDGADSVLELDPATLALRSAFAPSTWPHDNAQDLDLGSSAPAQLPNLRRMVIAGKAGTVYLLPERLGGVGSEIASLGGCKAYAGSAVSGTNVVMNCQINQQLRKLKVTATGLSWGWTAPADIAGSPTIAGSRVYVPNRADDTLYVLSLGNGAILQRLPLLETTHFPSVAIDNGYVFVNTLHGVQAFR